MGNGHQYGSWLKGQRSISLLVEANNNMDSDRCMDAMLDWYRPSGDHYDSRVVRSCQPGGASETNPNSTHQWFEPSDWDGATITDMQKGFGYVMDDHYDNGFEIYAFARFQGSGSAPIYATPPRTTVDCWARTRTRYQDGHVDATPDYAKRETQFGGC